MTNEEIKKKIVEVLKETINWATDYSIPIGIVYKSELDEIADALIAAGIGDIREAEHRAEVYYEALLSAAAYGDTPPDHYIEQAEKEFAEEKKR